MKSWLCILLLAIVACGIYEYQKPKAAPELPMVTAAAAKPTPFGIVLVTACNGELLGILGFESDGTYHQRAAQDLNNEDVLANLKSVPPERVHHFMPLCQTFHPNPPSDAKPETPKPHSPRPRKKSAITNLSLETEQ